MTAPDRDPIRERLPADALARAIDVALDAAEVEAPLWDALDAAVDALGPDAVRHALLRLAETDSEA